MLMNVSVRGSQRHVYRICRFFMKDFSCIKINPLMCMLCSYDAFDSVILSHAFSIHLIFYTRTHVFLLFSRVRAGWHDSVGPCQGARQTRRGATDRGAVLQYCSW